jgi:hypothetical protein
MSDTPKRKPFIPAWRYVEMTDDSPMPFGKHQDKKLKNIPLGYWEHLAEWDGMYYWPALADWIEKKLFGPKPKPVVVKFPVALPEKIKHTREEAVAAMRKCRESL